MEKTVLLMAQTEKETANKWLTTHIEALLTKGETDLCDSTKRLLTRYSQIVPTDIRNWSRAVFLGSKDMAPIISKQPAKLPATAQGRALFYLNILILKAILAEHFDVPMAPEQKKILKNALGDVFPKWLAS